MLNRKATKILLTVWLIKKIQLYEMSYFPETHIHSKNKTEFELDLSNYAKKSDLKNATGVDFTKKTYFLFCLYLIQIEHMFHISCGLGLAGFLGFAILSASLQALQFEGRSFDNFKDFKLQLTHSCQVFLGWPCSCLPITSCCVHFFIQP